MFYQVAVVWKHLAHPNIVPLLGVTTDPPQLISDWICDGDLTEYIASHPDADRLSLVRVPSIALYYMLIRSPVIGRRGRSQLSALLQHDSRKSQGST